MSERYQALHEKYLRDGERLLAEGDYVQASEKFWGAVAQMIKVVAEERGLTHSSHPALRRMVRQLYEEWQDEEYVTLLRSAERLHVNFYENDLSAEEVGVLVQDALRLISRLRSVRTGDSL